MIINETTTFIKEVIYLHVCTVLSELSKSMIETYDNTVVTKKKIMKSTCQYLLRKDYVLH